MTVVTCVFLDHVHHDPAQGDSLIADVTSFLFGQVAGVVQSCVSDQLTAAETSACHAATASSSPRPDFRAKPSWLLSPKTGGTF